MAKNIDVKSHVARYEDTAMTDVVALIDGLAELLEKRKQAEIEKYEDYLKILKEGNLPPAEEAPVVAKRTRKPKATKEDEA